MFLKSLEIFGFKSFADRTRIEFADGITALLGPNGCGKSNVVDAIKWVLGEQGSKTLRAESMEDVIFNGTESRKALSVAEATLTLSNEKNLLPLDTAEIVVRRRLYRNGESEYSINGAQVKLKELRELFYDTGVGKSAYSIMEQGKIDQVLSNKPEERRMLFEEAAGITKFRMRGLEAERKLEKTEENLRQVDGILGEVKRSYDALKKQAEKTETWRRLRDAGFELDTNIQLLRLRDAVEARERRKKELDEQETKRLALTKTIDGVNESLEAHIGEVNSLEGNFLEAQKQLMRIESDRDSKEKEIALQGERLGEIREKIEGERSRERLLTERLGRIDLDLGAARKEFDELLEHIKTIDSQVLDFTKSVELTRTRIRDNDSEIKRLELHVLDLDTQSSLAETELRELTDRITSQLDKSLGESGYSTQVRAETEKAFRQSLDRLQIALRGRKDFLDDLLSSKDAEIRSQGLDNLRAGFEELLDRCSETEASADSFVQAIPAFIDEFLAPEGTITRKRDIDDTIARLRGEIARSRGKSAELATENQSLSKRLADFSESLQDLRLAREREISRQNLVRERIDRAEIQKGEFEAQLIELKAILTEDEARIQAVSASISRLNESRAELDAQQKLLKDSLKQLQKGISKRNEDVESKEKELKSKMAQLAALQERIERMQLEIAEHVGSIKNLHENFREKHSRELGEFEDRMYEIRDTLADLKERAQANKDELRALGNVNLMALEEFAEVKERYDFLSGQIADLRKAREDLITVTREIRSESAALFIETFEKIRRNFHSLFRRLFGGGRAEIKLTDADMVLESGIEVYAQPPGKKLENITLLSGGERSLTAVALLFATYMVRPSPFCLLDEIDAALDEANVGRFVNMLVEFGHTSQFIIITHNKKTVTGAQTLLGVTMEESGISKIIAVRLSQEAPVDPMIEEVPDQSEDEQPLTVSGNE